MPGGRYDGLSHQTHRQVALTDNGSEMYEFGPFPPEFTLALLNRFGDGSRKVIERLMRSDG